MCHLHIVLQQVGPTSPPPGSQVGGAPHQHSIMYEVLADQTMWAVCGRTAGKSLFIGVLFPSPVCSEAPLTTGCIGVVQPQHFIGNTLNTVGEIEASFL